MCAFGDGLDAVVFFWVVRGRYVSCAIEVEIRTAGCEINCWGRGKADVGCFHAAFGDAFDEGFLEGWAGELSPFTLRSTNDRFTFAKDTYS